MTLATPPGLGGACPGALFTRMIPIAPAVWAFIAFTVNAQRPRSMTAILPVTLVGTWHASEVVPIVGSGVAGVPSFDKTRAPLTSKV